MNIINLKSLVIRPRQLQVLILAVASLFVFAGAHGGCGGGSSEPKIGRESACSVEMPRNGSACELEGQECFYDTSYTFCANGYWVIAQP